MSSIKSDEINNMLLKAQKEWANGIIQIGKAYIDKKDYLHITNLFINNLYSFQHKKVLFKPTKASQRQFRKSKSEFISYFIGHNKISSEDKGFALEPWKEINFQNFDFIKTTDLIITMGNYYFINYNDETTKVEYSFGYVINNINKLKIIFHHSSLPYK